MKADWRAHIDDIRVLALEQPADVGATEHNARLRTARPFHEPAQLRGWDFADEWA